MARREESLRRRTATVTVAVMGSGRTAFFLACLASFSCDSVDPPKEKARRGALSKPLAATDPVLQIVLTFDADTDLDLHVVTPSGSEIYYGNAFADGGALAEDLCVSQCGLGLHEESIQFIGAALSGEYRMWVENYDGRTRADFTVQVGGAVNDIFVGYVPNVSGAMSDEFLFVKP